MSSPDVGEVRTLPCKHCGTMLEHVWTAFAKPQWVALGDHAITACLRVLRHRAEAAEMMLLNEIHRGKKFMNEVNEVLEGIDASLKR